MIVTHKSRIPWYWVCFITIPWMNLSFVGSVNSAAITYTLKKFTSDPSLIAFLTSINLISNVVVGAVCNYTSDRVWTPWGRRRPFLISSVVATAIMMMFLPFMPNLLLLAAVNLIFQVVIDIGMPLEALYFEVIPQPQRGRAVAIRTVMMGFAGLYFWNVLFANFDTHYSFNLTRYGLGHLHLTGEILLYTFVAGFLLITGALLAFGVREVPVPGHRPPPYTSFKEFRRRVGLIWLEFLLVPYFAVRGLLRRVGALQHLPRQLRDFKATFLGEVFADKRWYLVYVYYAVPAVAAAGVAQFLPLVMTDRFGYSKLQMALISVPSMLIMLFVMTPFFGWLSDRVPRVRMFQFGIFGSVAWVTSYWLYIQFLAPLGFPSFALPNPLYANALLLEAGPVLPFGLDNSFAALADCTQFSFAPVDGVPSLAFIFSYGLFGAIFGTATTVTYGALLFDLIPSDRMGTLASGFGLINSVLSAFLMNLCGQFIKYYSRFFYAPNKLDPAKYDYASIYLFQVFFGLIAIAMYVYFLRQYKRGKVVEYGKMEYREELQHERAEEADTADLPLETDR
jgi:MFS family permease